MNGWKLINDSLFRTKFIDIGVQIDGTNIT